MRVTCQQFHTIPGDQDYDELSAVSLYFTAGTLVGSTDCATISITNDDILESDESFSLSLGSSDPVNLDDSMGTVLILEDADCEFVRFTADCKSLATSKLNSGKPQLIYHV